MACLQISPMLWALLLVIHCCPQLTVATTISTTRSRPPTTGASAKATTSYPHANSAARTNAATKYSPTNTAFVTTKPSKICFSCDHLLDPRTCNTTVACQAPMDTCFVEQQTTVDMRIVHHLGCAVFELCQEAALNHGHVGSIFGRRQPNTGWTSCVRCCQGDSCNNVFCPDNCKAAPCQSNGTCITTGISTFNCTCQAGFEGDNCERNINECKSSPCQNGGSCVDGVFGFTCTCIPGFTGSACEHSACDSNPCVNGVCHVNATGYSCQCYNGYTGVNCQINIDDCASAPCAHGGTCTDLVAGFRCSCPIKFTGVRCETERNETVCLNCKGIHSIQDCWNYTLCARGEYCFTLHTMTVGGQSEFTMGCRPEPACSAMTTAVQGRQVPHVVTLCAECCNTDLCNRLLCDVNVLGNECLQCSGVRSVDDCHTSQRCGSAEMCFMEEFLDLSSGARLQNFGCQRQGLCHYLSAMTTNVTAIGHLQNGDTSCYRCCSGSYCNMNHCRSCSSQPCLNNGTCVEHGNTFTCNCVQGRKGKYCEL